MNAAAILVSMKETVQTLSMTTRVLVKRVSLENDARDVSVWYCQTAAIIGPYMGKAHEIGTNRVDKIYILHFPPCSM